MTEYGKRSAEFTVDLGGLELPETTGRAIERNIRRGVLNALAEIDFDGDLVYKLPPDIYGIVIRPRDFVFRQGG